MPRKVDRAAHGCRTRRKAQRTSGPSRQQPVCGPYCFLRRGRGCKFQGDESRQDFDGVVASFAYFGGLFGSQQADEGVSKDGQQFISPKLFRNNGP
jgi:hypothetical protein